MNHEQVLRIARRQRSDARAFTERGDYRAARELLQSSAKRIRSFMESEADDSAARIDPTARVELARELLDTYGSLGGVERRAGRLREALAAYQQGRQIEEDQRYGIEESYNLTNSIVVALLLSPDELDHIRDDLQRAAQTVQQQVEGRRRKQWWAWADYGLLSMLLGDVETADIAYRTFYDCQPRRSDSLSVRQVLTSLAEAVESLHQDTADHLKQEAADIDRRIEGF